MASRSSVLVAVAALSVALLAGCSKDRSVPPMASPEGAGVGASPLCALLTAADFQEVAGLTPGSVQGGGSDTSATCLYGEHMELIVQIGPTVADATAVYDATLQTGWFAANVKANPIGGIDASSYGTGPEAAAIALRRQRLVLTVTVPGHDRTSPSPSPPVDGQTALVQLAGRARARASALGT